MADATKGDVLDGLRALAASDEAKVYVNITKAWVKRHSIPATDEQVKELVGAITAEVMTGDPDNQDGSTGQADGDTTATGISAS